jgi:hypothetical protein
VENKITSVIASAALRDLVALDAVAAKASLGKHEPKVRSFSAHAKRHNIADVATAENMGVTAVVKANLGAVIVIVKRSIYSKGIAFCAKIFVCVIGKGIPLPQNLSLLL